MGFSFVFRFGDVEQIVVGQIQGGELKEIKDGWIYFLYFVVANIQDTKLYGENKEMWKRQQRR